MASGDGGGGKCQGKCSETFWNEWSGIGKKKKSRNGRFSQTDLRKRETQNMEIVATSNKGGKEREKWKERITAGG